MHNETLPYFETKDRVSVQANILSITKTLILTQSIDFSQWRPFVYVVNILVVSRDVGLELASNKYHLGKVESACQEWLLKLFSLGKTQNFKLVLDVCSEEFHD